MNPIGTQHEQRESTIDRTPRMVKAFTCARFDLCLSTEVQRREEARQYERDDTKTRMRLRRIYSADSMSASDGRT